MQVSRMATDVHIVRQHDAFHKYATLFNRAQASRNVLFLAQLHHFQQEFAALDMRAQLLFKEQQHSFENDLSTLSLSHATQFGSFMEELDVDFNTHESDRQSKFLSSQAARRQKFENAQRNRQVSFDQQCRVMKTNTVESEGKRAMEFSMWKEDKIWELERKIREWRDMFEADEAKRDKQLEDRLVFA